MVSTSLYLRLADSDISPHEISPQKEAQKMTEIDKYIETHAQRFEDELCELVHSQRFGRCEPQGRHGPGRPVGLRAVSRRMNFAVEIIPTSGHPLVFAQSPQVAGAPTALVYGHYDVQPADPLEKWTTPPFEPTRRDGNLYARGATDNKGQVLSHIKSAEAWITVEGKLPINLKFLVEGEEEVGSRPGAIPARSCRPAGLRLRGH